MKYNPQTSTTLNFEVSHSPSLPSLPAYATNPETHCYLKRKKIQIFIVFFFMYIAIQMKHVKSLVPFENFGTGNSLPPNNSRPVGFSQGWEAAASVISSRGYERRSFCSPSGQWSEIVTRSSQSGEEVTRVSLR